MTRSRHGPPHDQSPQTILVFAVIAGVFLVAGVWFVMRSARTPEEPGPTRPPHAATGDAPTKTDPGQEARWWLDEQFFDEYGRTKPLSGQQVHDIVAAASERGVDAALGRDWAAALKRVYTRVLKREPDDPDANRFFGRRPLSDYAGFFRVFRRLSDERAIPKEFEQLRDRYEAEVRYGKRARAPAVDKSEFERVSAVLDRYQAYEKRMRENPTAKAIEEALARVKLHPILGSYETVHIERTPWVLFYAHRDLTKRDDSAAEQARVDKKRAELKGRLDSYTQLLNDYLAFFREMWIKPLGLSEFAPRQLFFVWMFDNRKRFDEFGASIRLPMPPSALGYFNPLDHWVYIYEPAQSRYGVESSLAHELTHQLHWHFSGDSGQFDNHFLRSKASWFKEGWGEFVGAGVTPGARYTFCGDAPERLDLFRACRKHNLPILPVRKLVRSENYVHHLLEVVGINTFSSPPTLVKRGWLQTELAKRNGTLKEGGVALAADLYLSMLYSEGWLFVKFLYEYKGGRYRKKILEFTRANLKGYLGFRGAGDFAQAHEAFAQVFALSTDADWAALQKEFDGYLEQKLREIPPATERGK